MHRSRVFTGFSLALATVALAVAPAAATTLVRQGLDRLVADNETVLVGQVVDIHSYWNDDRTFILTDVRVRPSHTLKGFGDSRDVVVTLMGGTVGDLTTLVIAGPELVPGSDYVLFLNREDLPGAPRRLTVRDLAQGVFDLADAKDGRRAVSQAVRHPLLPDAAGLSEPPGGEDGVALDEMIQRVRALAGRR